MNKKVGDADGRSSARPPQRRGGWAKNNRTAPKGAGFGRPNRGGFRDAKSSVTLEDRARQSHREDSRDGRPFKPRGSDRPSRQGGGNWRVDKPSAGDRPFHSRGEESRDGRPFKPRGSDRPSRQGGGNWRADRPAAGDRPFRPRGEESRGGRPITPRGSDRPSRQGGGNWRADRPAAGDRPFRPRGEQSRGGRPFKPRDSDHHRRDTKSDWKTDKPSINELPPRARLKKEDDRESPEEFLEQTENEEPRRRKTKAHRGSSPREEAARIYAVWLKNHRRLEALTQPVLDRCHWDARDRGLFNELAHGLVRMYGRLKWILDQLANSDGFTTDETFAAAALGAYQLLFLDRIPDFAAVDTAVDIANKGHDKSGSLVNAVLRRLGRELDHWKTALPDTHDEAALLSAKFSYPTWLIHRWQQNLGVVKMIGFLEWNNRRPEVILRVNTRIAEREDVTATLDAEGVGYRISPLNDRFIITDHTGDERALTPVKQGLASVQDHAQGLVPLGVNPRPGERILDLCSAPGGKTGFLAELCPECRIIATDKAPDRLRLVRELAARNNYDNIQIKPYEEVVESRETYDAILLDVPCTGTGVLARRPDLRWRRAPDDIPRMAGVQSQLLRYASNRLNPGGRIIYSTCSVEPEENRQVVEAFLQDVRALKMTSFSGLIADNLLDNEGRLNLLGPEVQGNGVFAVKLEKRHA